MYYLLALAFNSEKQVYYCEANSVGVHNEQMNCFMHNRLLTNCLHGKAAEQCLASS